jgi:RNA polymerase sigma-70 factor (ECF subfamily)
VALSADEVAELYDRHAEAILAFLVRRTWDPEVAVDILAETFALALEGRHRFRGRGRDAAGGAWLYGIARHLLADHFRRDGAQRRALARLGIERRPLTDIEYERIEELAGSCELRDRVAEELDALPVEQREAVRLRVVEEQGYQTLAQTLDISQDTARARVSRGLQALRSAIDAATARSPIDLQRSTDHA